jgi:hypothetical protein
MNRLHESQSSEWNWPNVFEDLKARPLAGGEKGAGRQIENQPMAREHGRLSSWIVATSHYSPAADTSTPPVTTAEGVSLADIIGFPFYFK